MCVPVFGQVFGLDDGAQVKNAEQNTSDAAHVDSRGPVW